MGVAQRPFFEGVKCCRKEDGLLILVVSLFLASFLFLYFSKTFFTEIYFQYYNLQFCIPTARQGGGRGPAAQQRGGRDLYVNFKKIYLRGSPWREPAAPWRAAGGLPPARGAAGSLLWTTCCGH